MHCGSQELGWNAVLFLGPLFFVTSVVYYSAVKKKNKRKTFNTKTSQEIKLHDFYTTDYLFVCIKKQYVLHIEDKVEGQKILKRKKLKS